MPQKPLFFVCQVCHSNIFQCNVPLTLTPLSTGLSRDGAHKERRCHFTWVPLFSRQLYGYMESEPLTLQLFIGTADDRLLRPHAFYQVHRITGKTVSTASHEVMQSNTKILEIPLLPENNMRAMWALVNNLFVTFWSALTYFLPLCWICFHLQNSGTQTSSPASLYLCAIIILYMKACFCWTEVIN